MKPARALCGLLAALALHAPAATAPPLTRYVDPFIGTDGAGHVFPGAGIPEPGDMLLQPAAGTRWSTTRTDFAAACDKASERAQPGCYSATLPALGVMVELTATRIDSFSVSSLPLAKVISA